MRRVCVIMVLSILTACAPPASEGGFDSDNPASKLYAITHAGKNRDRDAIPHLVDQLDSDDPAVRMMSIDALERITGERLGYNPYASPQQRRPAIDAWTAAVARGRFTSDSPPADTQQGSAP